MVRKVCRRECNLHLCIPSPLFGFSCRVFRIKPRSLCMLAWQVLCSVIDTSFYNTYLNSSSVLLLSWQLLQESIISIALRKLSPNSKHSVGGKGRGKKKGVCPCVYVWGEKKIDTLLTLIIKGLRLIRVVCFEVLS